MVEAGKKALLSKYRKQGGGVFTDSQTRTAYKHAKAVLEAALAVPPTVSEEKPAG